MLKITEELDQIIFRYDLDRHYPMYRKSRAAEKILRRLVDDAISGQTRVVFIANGETEMDILNHMSCDSEWISCLCIKDLRELDKIDWTKYEKKYILSFVGSERMESFFRKRGFSCEWVYDLFEDESLYFERDFFRFNKEDYADYFPWFFAGTYGWRNNILLELYFQKNNYTVAKTQPQKIKALEKLVFLSLYLKNFVYAEKIIQALTNIAGNRHKVAAAWKEIQKLLEHIRQQVKARKSKDIILYWLDSIYYGMEKEMPYLTKQMEASAYFTKAFTMVPHTNPTVRTMFFGKKELDDRVYRIQKVTEKNSPVLRLLKEKGYDFRVISGALRTFDWECLFGERHEVYEPSSMMYWDMLQCLLESQRPVVVLTHVLEAHSPCLNTKLNDQSIHQWWLRYVQAVQDVDEQLAFYDSFVTDDTLCFFMSDHGMGELFSTRHHILFSIRGKTIKPRKIDSLFSLINFHKLFAQIIETGEFDEQEHAQEYLEIQFPDWYNRHSIENLIMNKAILPIWWLGYRGIVTTDCLYIRFNVGPELLMEHDKVASEPSVFVLFHGAKETSLLLRFRELAGKNPSDVVNDSKFQNAKYLHRVYRNYSKRVTKVMRLIEGLLEQYPEHSIGIRMGGGHSEGLYRFLSPESKKKICCFIDRNPHCDCARFGLPVVSLEESMEMGLQAIILSSLAQLPMLKQEAGSYRKGIDVIDIYACLEENGIVCTESFSHGGPYYEGIYDVGYPLSK